MDYFKLILDEPNWQTVLCEFKIVSTRETELCYTVKDYQDGHDSSSEWPTKTLAADVSAVAQGIEPRKTSGLIGAADGTRSASGLLVFMITLNNPALIHILGIVGKLLPLLRTAGQIHVD